MNTLKSIGASTARLLLMLTVGLIALLMLSPPTATSQVRRWLPDSTVAPMKRMYNVPATEFTIGAYSPPSPPSGQAADYWPFLDSLGMNLFIWSATGVPTFWDDLATSRYNSTQRYIPDIQFNGHKIEGQQAMFYPFDSVETSMWLCRFTGLAGGDSTYNFTMNSSERHYDITNTSAGDSVAWGIVYDWLIPGRNDGDAYRHSYDYLIATEKLRGLPVPDTQYVAVTGHLFAGGTASASTPVLNIKVWYMIPTGSHYVDGGGGSHTAMSDTSLLYTTLNVRKDSLAPVGPDFDQYRTVTLPLPLNSVSGVPGPLHTGNDSHRFDLRVFWTGAEKVALRSVAIRDSIGELILGSSPASVNYRTSTLYNDARRLLYGPYLNDTTQREKVYGIQVGSEPVRSFAACYAVVDSMLRSNFHSSTDTVYADVIENADAAFDELSDARIVDQEIGYMDTFTPFTPATAAVNYSTIPLIQEHNGDATLGIPELVVDRDSIESYEESMQRLWYGWYTPDSVGYPGSYWLGWLGRAAEMARRSGRSLFGCGGVKALIGKFIDSVQVRDSNGAYHIVDGDSLVSNSTSRDTLKNVYSHTRISHLPEIPEMRMTANLALCYGARGYSYWELNSDTNALRDTMRFANTTLAWGFYDCLGPLGFQSNDTTTNRMDYMLKHYAIHDSANTFAVDTLKDLYTGWQARSRELKRLDRWMRRVGEEMMQRNLRWRDSYSIHYGTARPFHGDGDDWDSTRPLRPLPSDEIITNVETRTRYGSLDSAWARYVELGFFYTQTDSAKNTMSDTNYVYVVNRRCFERPEDVTCCADSTTDVSVMDSARTALMDSLSEMRVIRLKLNLRHPDTTQYNFVRVREIEPDVTPLPEAPYSLRHSLDTTVYADSAISIVLGAGRGALLEIRYLPADSSVAQAALPYNGQRKIVYSGLRYYSVFERDSSGTTKIYYRRSVKMRGDSTGSILWEPPEYEISNDNGQGPTRSDHRTPSLTLRILNGDTVVTAVWSCHSTNVFTGQREIVLRNIHHNGDNTPTQPFPAIESVDASNGTDPTSWGTPVICWLSPGDVIAYSDSIVGIIARLRFLDTSATWWNAAGTYSSQVAVDALAPSQWDRYPTVPTFGNIHFQDSTCAIAWQLTDFTSLPTFTHDIRYTRLFYDTLAGGLNVVNTPAMLISTGSGNHFHPSIDLVQDVWGGLYEGLTWETIVPGHWTGVKYSNDQISVNFTSLYTPFDTAASVRRLTLATQFWMNRNRKVANVAYGTAQPVYYPNTASIDSRYDSSSQNEKILFSLAYTNNSSTSSSMMQDLIQFDVDSLDSWPNPRPYTWGGGYPNASATWLKRADWLPDTTISTPCGDSIIIGHMRAEGWDRQQLRPAVLFQQHSGSDSLLRTSRQFFAKMRPGGYMAHGREVLLRINDSLSTAISMHLHDVWMATDSIGQTLPMVHRDSTHLRIDSLAEVGGLLRTRDFTVSDSVQIGFEVGGQFIGDSASAGAANVAGVVELVDSSGDSVIAVLDSFAISNTSPIYEAVNEPVVDLLSGTYYVRMRLVPTSMPSVDTTWYSKYPVTEVFSWVDDPPLSKLGREGAVAGAKARITAQPNPFAGSTEIRFSIPSDDNVTLTLYDQLGREVARALDHTPMQAGRFAVDLDATHLTPGTYMVELRTTTERVVEKIVVMR